MYYPQTELAIIIQPLKVQLMRQVPTARGTAGRIYATVAGALNRQQIKQQQQVHPGDLAYYLNELALHWEEDPDAGAALDAIAQQAGLAIVEE